ncbi:hypothetical protein KP509_05G083500 [Ceratopteris richardii]|uniref:Uncharacterized protein n=1 Tax=Ceratopteris richardii TaxID=49495 RepID=A0A8T2UUU5_CERRI|nr:hypothetical protein KP509_05G083500 [Ceratopteris richardii]
MEFEKKNGTEREKRESVGNDLSTKTSSRPCCCHGFTELPFLRALWYLRLVGLEHMSAISCRVNLQKLTDKKIMQESSM